METTPNKDYTTIRWILLSQFLLAAYLAFFHSVLGKSPTEIMLIGFGFAALTTVIVVACRNVFFNRFEYWIHLVIGVDIFFESLVPFHQSLGFYYCALAFWSVFWGYHGLLLYRRRSKPTLTSTTSTTTTSTTVPTATPAGSTIVGR